MQVTGELESSMERLRELCRLRASISPLATHAALTYNMCQAEKTSALGMLSWRHFSQLFSQALQLFLQTQSGEVTPLVLEGVVRDIQPIITRFNKTLLQDAFR